MTTCIACGFPRTHILFKLENQPLAALHLPHSLEEARGVERLPLHFHACADCGHIFNVDFDYGKVPYENNSNLMYNTGESWIVHMDQLAQRLVKANGEKPATWLEIGCGDGNFLERIGTFAPAQRLVGFEPGVEARAAAKRGIEAIEDYFLPERDLKKYRPDFLICRHVIEHLPAPREFLAEIAHWCEVYGLSPCFIAEVPSIEKAITSTRINDYLYEHVSNFTVRSFKALFESSGFAVDRSETGYGDEVLVIEARPKIRLQGKEIAGIVADYRAKVLRQLSETEVIVNMLRASGKTIAFWGGTGKGAAFLNGYRILAEDFPIVVDSDYNKVGRYVPHAGQRIEAPEYLNEHPVDVIVITTQWRARDIYNEILRRKIPHEKVYVLLNRQLVAYRGEAI